MATIIPFPKSKSAGSHSRNRDFLSADNCIELADCATCGATQWESCVTLRDGGVMHGNVHATRRSQAYIEATKLRELRGFIEVVEMMASAKAEIAEAMG